MANTIVKMSLHEAIPILSHINKELQKKRSERRDVAVVRFRGDEQIPITDEVDVLTEEIDALVKASCILQSKISEANRTNHVDFQIDGRTLSIDEAIDYARQLRLDIRELDYLASQSVGPRLEQNRWGTETIYTKAVFDVNKYKKLLARTKKKANRLSLEIDRANFNTYIQIDREKDFDPSDFVEMD